MRKLVFNSCFGCIDLKMACIIVSCVGIIATTILSVSSIMVVLTGIMTLLTSGPQYIKVDRLVTAGVFILLLVLLLGFTFALFVGVIENRRKHVKAYLIFSILYLVIGLIVSCVCIGLTIPRFVVIGNFIFLLIYLSFLVVVRSYYYKLKDASNGPIINDA